MDDSFRPGRLLSSCTRTRRRGLQSTGRSPTGRGASHDRFPGERSSLPGRRRAATRRRVRQEGSCRTAEVPDRRRRDALALPRRWPASKLRIAETRARETARNPRAIPMQRDGAACRFSGAAVAPGFGRGRQRGVARADCCSVEPGPGVRIPGGSCSRSLGSGCDQPLMPPSIDSLCEVTIALSSAAR